MSFHLFLSVLFSRPAVGANARQPLPLSLIGGSAAVVQSQQQRVEFSIPHGPRSRKHTYVLNPVNNAQKTNKTNRAVRCIFQTLFSSCDFRPAGQRSAIGSRRAGTLAWRGPGRPGVRCDFSGAQQGEQEEPLRQRSVSKPGVIQRSVQSVAVIVISCRLLVYI